MPAVRIAYGIGIIKEPFERVYEGGETKKLGEQSVSVGVSRIRIGCAHGELGRSHGRTGTAVAEMDAFGAPSCWMRQCTFGMSEGRVIE